MPAVLVAWYPGQEGCTALARVLFGDVSPGGKLPVTVPRSVGQLPMFFNHKPTARRGYRFHTTESLWPFGFGLSYTTFEVSEPTLDRATIGVGESATVSVKATNTVQREGDEVVQLYLRDEVSSVTRPVRELIPFERATLAPAASILVLTPPFRPVSPRSGEQLTDHVVDPVVGNQGPTRRFKAGSGSRSRQNV